MVRRIRSETLLTSNAAWRALLPPSTRSSRTAKMSRRRSSGSSTQAASPGSGVAPSGSVPDGPGLRQSCSQAARARRRRQTARNNPLGLGTSRPHHHERCLPVGGGRTRARRDRCAAVEPTRRQFILPTRDRVLKRQAAPARLAGFGGADGREDRAGKASFRGQRRRKSRDAYARSQRTPADVPRYCLGRVSRAARGSAQRRAEVEHPTFRDPTRASSRTA
jgi:hypothetical protein